MEAERMPEGANQRLADMYADRHERLDRFIVMYAIPEGAFAGLGIRLHSALGYGLLFLVVTIAILVPALVIGWLAGEWSEGLLVRAFAASAALAGLNVAALILAQSAAYRISAIHRALVDENQIRAMMAWDRRWYSPAASAVVGGLIALVLLVVVHFVTLLATGTGLPPTTFWFCAMVALFLGQFCFSIGMIFFEFRAFSTCRFELYALRPIETRALQTTASGLKQLGIVSIVLFPLLNLVLLSVLPQGSGLNVVLTAGFVLLAYVATGVGIVFPLMFLGTIVEKEKERRLAPLEHRLDAMVSHIASMSDATHEAFQRIEALRNTIADSEDSFLSLGSVARVVGAAALSTVTVVATAAIQLYLQRTI